MCVKYNESRVTPEYITREWIESKEKELSAEKDRPVTIYPVIGINLEQNLKVGSARNIRKTGAVSIGIPVYSIKQRRALSISEIHNHVKNLYDDLKKAVYCNKNNKIDSRLFYFAITKIGIKTHDIIDIAALFSEFTEYDNVFLPREIWELLYW